ncbi:MAG: RNA polymerase sigma-54 factor [Alphaproteobacteria bacterium]|nr:RNA polymerase sigma-54 factor [Alphaproteobacteria bacterium]
MLADMFHFWQMRLTLKEDIDMLANVYEDNFLGKINTKYDITQKKYRDACDALIEGKPMNRRDIARIFKTKTDTRDYIIFDKTVFPRVIKTEKYTIDKDLDDYKSYSDFLNRDKFNKNINNLVSTTTNKAYNLVNSLGTFNSQTIPSLNDPLEKVFNDLDFIAEMIKISIPKLESILEKLHQLEPVGIYARNLEECLSLQLKDKNIFDDTIKILLSRLDLLASMDIKSLIKITSCSKEKILTYIQIIKTLEPKPGRNFAYDKVSVKIPDAYIFVGESGDITVRSNNEAIPGIKIDEEFYRDVKSKVTRPEDKEYTSNMIQSAISLIKSLEMRGKTIVLVASAIAKEQEEFFRRGVLYLRPLTLSRIACITGYNESTISRATVNKYVSTPYGVLEMKYFFSSGVKSKYSEEGVSSQKVRELIKSIIMQESKDNPLSDQDIAQELKRLNVLIARRTVTKYRESIDIPPRKDRKTSYQKDLCY